MFVTTSHSTGIHFDDIELKSVHRLRVESTKNLSQPSFIFNETTIGTPLIPMEEYFLKVRQHTDCLSTRYGPSFPTMRKLSYAEWVAANSYDLPGGVEGDEDDDGTPNGIEYALGLNPLDEGESSGRLLGSLVQIQSGQFN